jgi:hypothetical protein
MQQNMKTFLATAQGNTSCASSIPQDLISVVMNQGSGSCN